MGSYLGETSWIVVGAVASHFVPIVKKKHFSVGDILPSDLHDPIETCIPMSHPFES